MEEGDLFQVEEVADEVLCPAAEEGGAEVQNQVEEEEGGVAGDNIQDQVRVGVVVVEEEEQQHLLIKVVECLQGWEVEVEVGVEAE